MPEDRYVVVPPQNPGEPGSGWTVWTADRDPNYRVCWVGNRPAKGGRPSSEQLAHRIAAAMNTRMRRLLPDVDARPVASESMDLGFVSLGDGLEWPNETVEYQRVQRARLNER